MSLQQPVQAKNSNGFGRRNFDREMGTRTDSKARGGRSSSSSYGNAGLANGGKVSCYDGPSRDRLVYVTTCLVGQFVEVQVKNGSIYSGIFHAMSAEREFGVILKMARLVKDVSLRGSKLPSDTVSKPPSNMLIIPGKEVIQVIAKDVSLSGDGSINSHTHDKKQDILIDSCISQSHYAEERELERWIPDVDDPQCPEFENIFDGTRNRNWDQFEINEALFGVKSTFNEELYTTKLERGPQMREREREALRIAREIEGEETEDIHLAEERGLHLYDDLDIDEETRFSSVYRGIDDGRDEENADTFIDSRNNETFGSSRGSATNRSFSDVIRGKVHDGVQAPSSCPSLDDESTSHVHTGREPSASSCGDQLKQQVLDSNLINIHLVDADSRVNDNQCMEQSKKPTECNHISGKAESLKSEEMHQLSAAKKCSSDKCGSHAIRTSSASNSLQALEHTGHLGDLDPTESSKAARQPTNIRVRPSSSASSASEHASAASASSRCGLSPSSSVGSLSSEKSTLNPNAKEFKLNPNAKSFTPSSAPFRPSGPSEGSFYYHAGVSAVPPMSGLPMGMGMGSSFGGHQPVIYSQQAPPMLSHQGYVQPNGPLYGQQVFVGQPRPMLYTPNYPPDVQYK